MIKEKRKREREDQERIDDGDVNYADELAQAFNRPQRGKPEDDHISPDHIPDPNHRRERIQEEIEEARRNEPPKKRITRSEPFLKNSMEANARFVTIHSQKGMGNHILKGFI